MDETRGVNNSFTFSEAQSSLQCSAFAVINQQNEQFEDFLFFSAILRYFRQKGAEVIDRTYNKRPSEEDQFWILKMIDGDNDGKVKSVVFKNYEFEYRRKNFNDSIFLHSRQSGSSSSSSSSSSSNSILLPGTVQERKTPFSAKRQIFDAAL